MRGLTEFFDILMTLLWSVTYTLVLIGTIRYRYPLISLMGQAIIAPFELAVVLHFIVRGNFNLSLVPLSYTYWTIFEAAIICILLKLKGLKKKELALYLLFLGAMTALMIYLVTFKGHMLIFAYANTFLGQVFWLLLVRRKDYPMTPWTLSIFVIKFVADVILIPVYLHMGIWINQLLCILLPILEALFILEYSKRKEAEFQNSASKKAKS